MTLQYQYFKQLVDQTISGLACGKPIRGKSYIFRWTQLHFLDKQERFIKNTKFKGREYFAPENSEIYVALGAAILSENNEIISSKELIKN